MFFYSEEDLVVVQNGIIQENLVLHYDISDSNSYPGSGNLLSDLVGPTDGFMSNVTYDSQNGGSLVFDESSLVDIPSSLGVLSTDFTISLWYRNTAGNNFKVLFETEGYRTGANGLSIYLQGDRVNIYKLTNSRWTSMITTPYGSAGLNVWKNLVLKRENSILSLYIDGVQAGNTYTVSQNFADTNYNMGGTVYPFFGNIAQLAIYEVALSDFEIAQNFDTIKTRFGL